MSFNWTCPYCNRPQTVVHTNVEKKDTYFDTVPSNIGLLALRQQMIVCCNQECQKATVTVDLISATKNSSGYFVLSRDPKVHLRQRLIPNSSAKPQPEYIPEPIREDYLEACLIGELSPKASATLARRCLQGIIRDFCGISKTNLNQEIIELKKQVDGGNAPAGVSIESVEAIDHMRGIGNIGAHMEKDINQIVSVDPDEAQALIELIEVIFEDWYVARENRKNRFARVAEIGAAKKEVKARAAPKAEYPRD